MRKEARLRRKPDFAAVQRGGLRWSNHLFTLRALPNDSDTARFGFIVSKRVGNAVVRNRVRRRLREIARAEEVPGGWDLLIIARAKSADASFPSLRDAYRGLLRRGRLAQPSAAGTGAQGRKR